LSRWKVNLGPSLRSYVLWRSFPSRISLYSAPFIFPSILTGLPVPGTEKHPHRMMLPPPCFTRYSARFPPDVTLGIQAKETLVSHGLRVLKCLLANSTRAVAHAFYWGMASIWPLYHKGLIGGVLQRWLSFWKVLPLPQRNSVALSEWPSGSWSPPWPRPFSSDCQL
jgi:hypothetical protein